MLKLINVLECSIWICNKAHWFNVYSFQIFSCKCQEKFHDNSHQACCLLDQQHEPQYVLSWMHSEKETCLGRLQIDTDDLK